MKTKILTIAATTLMLFSCNKHKEFPSATSSNEERTSANIQPCNIYAGNVTFTHAINGADSCITIENGNISYRSFEGKDFFIDPNEGKSTKLSLPILLKEIDNTKPFTFYAKVSPEFTKDGLYNAADLYVYANDTIWQKLAFEQDEYGNHRIVSVRTNGTSDDNNHDIQTASSIYLKLSSDTHTIASYYSTDKEEWHMVRLYKNYYPAKIYLGIASQCPTKGSCTSTYSDITFNQQSVEDFRLGE